MIDGPTMFEKVHVKIGGNLRRAITIDVGNQTRGMREKIRGVEIEDNRVTVELEGDDKRVAFLLDQLTTSGVKLRSFNDKDPTLEDVFMLVTKGLVT